MMFVKRSTLQLLRIPFSLFLLPVYLFALAFSGVDNLGRAILFGLVLHLLVYPSSNGYNSLMDQDKGPIGGLEKPPAPERELFWVTLFLDALALLLVLPMGLVLFGGLLVYIVFSRLYSYRGIRLKRFPIIGYLTVVLNQGALVFLLARYAAGNDQLGFWVTGWDWLPVGVAAGLIGGFYPITQVYQHEADAADGVDTLSRRLGTRGTFVYCTVVYGASFAALFYHAWRVHRLPYFFLLQIFFLPVLVYFMRWFYQVWQDPQAANFKHTMNMNKWASLALGLAFFLILILEQID